ncbi:MULTISPECIES: D-alanine--D-alanine ligase [unclassified Photobacterium]|uniref:D-alanine--D-alanine ligase n=1 Tax=unclassified Photobacterium TaxID=2628852 RepID=UPI001EE0B54E|nr:MULTISPECIES: D-alanine--D-alanine ligase [unclassified Photobacterium]MCG3865582.1 D-alanine--D-alanine ligase [Photobacterium sp. Ph6]MCG3877083.1 D-alanine--D-alanine ligase [Photobacterium sp. Ph5]
MRIGVLCGGRSSEREVSLKSGARIIAAIKTLGHEAIHLDPCDIDISMLNLYQLDKVFIALHGGIGESGHIQSLLDILQIPYVGCGLLSSAVSLNKLKTKEVWLANNLLTAPWVLIRKAMTQQEILACCQNITFPVVIKPLNQGCSIGVTKADNEEQLWHALLAAFEYDAEVLVEQFIAGREYTCAVLNDKALPVVQICSESFFDWSAKFGTQSATYHCPSDLNADEESAMQASALSAYQALGCRGWGRVDVILTENNDIYLIEMNTIPGMTERSVYPMAAAQAGFSYEELISELLDQAQFDHI